MTGRADHIELDVLIFGGGVAGLWLLDELHRRGFSALLVESKALGAGQSIASQGILHGGLKYALGGIVSDSSASVREMPQRWKASLLGRDQPDLRGTRVFSPHCYLWRTDSLTSRLGLLGARVGLQTPVKPVNDADRPPPLKNCPGQVFRVDELVLDVGSLLGVLADRHRPRIMLVADAKDVAISASSTGQIEFVELRHPVSRASLRLTAAAIVLTAGEGNASLRHSMGLTTEVMQRRPLHMVMIRGDLPQLFGHCVDGNKTRMTITSAVDRSGRTVWHVGGEIAEQGVGREGPEQIVAAKRELMTVLPGIDLGRVEWASYRIDRAEGQSADGRRPDGPVWRREGKVISAWPTKLVLAPKLAEKVADELGRPTGRGVELLETLADWPRPFVADPPWEVIREWHS